MPRKEIKIEASKLTNEQIVEALHNAFPATSFGRDLYTHTDDANYRRIILDRYTEGVYFGKIKTS